jgi:diguanylate cyclase (GGDEF)-like protein/putative nucleotidyltransferase with HDIG domain
VNGAVEDVVRPSERQPKPARRRRNLGARAAMTLLVAACIGLDGMLVTRLGSDTKGWTAFACFAVAAAVTQLFVSRSLSSHVHESVAVFTVAAALVLPPEMVVLLPLAQLLPEWLKQRYALSVQATTISCATLASFAAWSAADLVLGPGGIEKSSTLETALAGLAAAAAFVFVDHVLVAIAQRQTGGGAGAWRSRAWISWLGYNLALAALGVVIALIWTYDIWLALFAVAPLALAQRSLTVPKLQEEARIDPKTGLYNARHFGRLFTDELARSVRYGHPLSVLMVDLDLLREINNAYGHLAGDAVLCAVADVFRSQLRNYDIAARFGGEEFSIVLPETSVEKALEIAERIRRAVAARSINVSTSGEPIHATVSIGVACFPNDGADQNALVHQADLAVYRAKLQGRNRVQAASAEAEVLAPPLAGHPDLAAQIADHEERTDAAVSDRPPRPHAGQSPYFLSLSFRLGVLVTLVSATGIGTGAIAIVLSHGRIDWKGIIAVTALVGIGQALAIQVDDGSISVSAVGTIAGVALFDVRVALLLAVTTSVVEWSARRSPPHQVLFNIGALSLAGLSAGGVFHVGELVNPRQLSFDIAGIVAGGVYFLVNTGLLSTALALEGHESWLSAWRERFTWLVPHYLAYGLFAALIAIAYKAVGIGALLIFALPLLVMRKTQEDYLGHAQRSAGKLRQAAETIQKQNLSLEQANRLLRQRSTAAMESLSATVDARDSYTAGHSRRVQQLALAIGREIGLSQAELDILGQAALFHDIGKLAVPDSVLLKPANLNDYEWELMRRHADEGARIIERLGFLADAVPAIRHHHEHYDGSGYPDGLVGEEIPLGARIIHVADALDSMLTTRTYRSARQVRQALLELRDNAGDQFCPRCVSALERILPVEPGKSGNGGAPDAEPAGGTLELTRPSSFGDQIEL